MYLYSILVTVYQVIFICRYADSCIILPPPPSKSRVKSVSVKIKGDTDTEGLGRSVGKLIEIAIICKNFKDERLAPVLIKAISQWWNNAFINELQEFAVETWTDIWRDWQSTLLWERIQTSECFYRKPSCQKILSWRSL